MTLTPELHRNMIWYDYMEQGGHVPENYYQ